MKSCEYISGEAKQIEEIQSKIQNEVEGAKQVQKDLEFSQENIISKEEHIERLYMFIGHIGVNFRKQNYAEIDRVLKEVNL